MNYLKGLKHTRFIRFLRHANLLKYKKITPRKVLKFQLQSNTVMSPSSSSSEVYTTAFKAKIFHRICNNPAKLFCHCWTSKKHSIADYLNRKRLVPRACVYSVHIEYLPPLLELFTPICYRWFYHISGCLFRDEMRQPYKILPNPICRKSQDKAPSVWSKVSMHHLVLKQRRKNKETFK